MSCVGLVSVDPERKWIGGRYYLQHLVRCVAALPPDERVAFADVWWGTDPHDDPFAEVRPLLARRVVIAPRDRLVPRLVRRARRTRHRWPDGREPFIGACIAVLFLSAPCAAPRIARVAWMPDLQP